MESEVLRPAMRCKRFSTRNILVSYQTRSLLDLLVLRARLHLHLLFVMSERWGEMLGPLLENVHACEKEWDLSGCGQTREGCPGVFTSTYTTVM
jgi:hypothetical protein